MSDERKTLAIDHVFDIETQDWDTFVLGGVLSADGTYKSFNWREEEAFARHLLSLHGTLWAFNGGRYDSLWLLDWIARLDIKAQVFASSARVTLIKVGKVQVRDLAALWPGIRLEDAARVFGATKRTTGLECRCVKACGGYCRIRRDMTAADLDTLGTYLRADCEATIAVGSGLVGAASERDLDLRGTIGSSAWSFVQRTYGIPDADWGEPEIRWSRYSFARRAYYGGRTQVFRPESAHGWRYDLNSAYPAALAAVSLPVGEARRVGPAPARRAFMASRPGVYEVAIDVPVMHVPPLPWRGGDGRVYYPTGRLYGTWTGLEIETAIDAGARVHEWGAALVWPDASPVLAPFANRLWNERASIGKASRLGKWLKLYANSLTGKLAQRPDGDTVYINPDDPKPCPGIEHCSIARTGKHDCGCWDSLDLPGRVWTAPHYRLPKNGYVHWAAYLTAYARRVLYQRLREAGRAVVYCDTDSVYAERELGPNGTESDLGAWLCEGEYKDFVSLAPKTYRFIGDKGEVVRAKGIPKPDWQAINDRRTIVIDSGVRQLRSAARAGGGLFRRRELARTVRADGTRFGDRIRKGRLTHPVDMVSITECRVTKPIEHSDSEPALDAERPSHKRKRLG